MQQTLNILGVLAGVVVVFGGIGSAIGLCVYAGRIVERLDTLIRTVGALDTRVAVLENASTLSSDAAEAEILRRRAGGVAA